MFGYQRIHHEVQLEQTDPTWNFPSSSSSSSTFYCAEEIYADASWQGCKKSKIVFSRHRDTSGPRKLTVKLGAVSDAGTSKSWNESFAVCWMSCPSLPSLTGLCLLITKLL